MRCLRYARISRGFAFRAALILSIAAAGLPLLAQAQEKAKIALVMGNGAYARLPTLHNPINDAADMAAALRKLGFETEVVVDGNYAKMMEASERFGKRLAGAEAGFFFYAGHGVASGGINYLVPIDASIDAEYQIRFKAMSVDYVLESMNASGCSLNIVALDACRDNPFGSVRSLGRGLTVVGNAPPGAVIAYATDPGKSASEGTGRNGVFTAALLKHIATPGLELKELFDRVGADVAESTRGTQTPWQSSKFYGKYYLAGMAPAKAPSFGAVKAATGSLSITLASPGTVSVAGLSSRVPAGTVPVNDLPAGEQTVTVRYADGKTESLSVRVPAGGAASVSLTYVPALKPSSASMATALPTERAPGGSLRGEIFIQGGAFRMGSENGEKNEQPVHTVTVSSFWMMKTEMTQKDYAELTGINPSYFKGDDLPVETVSWYDAAAYANLLSRKDGLKPVYRIDGTSVQWNRDADGWRLPTEAEWEYAAKGGIMTQGHLYAGSNDVGSVAWFEGNSGKKTQPAGMKAPNELGLHDMSGNVWEWCWDRYGSYGSSGQTDPSGASSGIRCVDRGGSWAGGASGARTVDRCSDPPDFRFNFLGFRLVRSAQ